MREYYRTHSLSSGFTDQSRAIISHWSVRGRRRRFTLIALIAVFLFVRLLNSGNKDNLHFDSRPHTGKQNNRAPHLEPSALEKLENKLEINTTRSLTRILNYQS